MDLTQVEQMAGKLTAGERRILAQKLEESLNGNESQTLTPAEYKMRIQVFLKLCRDDAARLSHSAESSRDIRQIREERTARL